ncbi:MAG TPA: alpha/beta hydrolase fold domain-containing protein [Solirubrobacter sp.]
MSDLHPTETVVMRDLEYARHATSPLLLDLHLPARPVAPPPVVVWLHGGGWRKGDRSFAPDLDRSFAARGYAMANVEYRLSGDAIFPAQLDDVRAAVRWLRASAGDLGVDASSIGLWGSSAGGHLAALAATTATDERDRVQAVVDGYGPTDFALADAQTLPGGMPHAPADSPESELLGVPLAEAGADLLRAANPIAHVTPKAPPFLIMHGTADLLVPPGQSEILHAALVAAGVESTLCLLDGLGHAFFNGRELEPRPCPAVTIRSFVPARGERSATRPAAPFELIERFLDRHLRRDPNVHP